MSETPAPDTYFVVVVSADGGIATFNNVTEALPEPNHRATNWDVFQAAKQIVAEYESSLLADRVAKTVLNALSPQPDMTSDLIKDKLKERGINPESVTPAE